MSERRIKRVVYGGAGYVVCEEGGMYTAWAPAYGGDAGREIRVLRGMGGTELYARVGSERFVGQSARESLVQARQEKAVQIVLAAHPELAEAAYSTCEGRVEVPEKKKCK